MQDGHVGRLAHGTLFPSSGWGIGGMRQGVEATLFATLMSIGNASFGTSRTLGAALTSLLGITSTNFDRLTLLVALCAFTRFLLPSSGTHTHAIAAVWAVLQHDACKLAANTDFQRSYSKLRCSN